MRKIFFNDHFVRLVKSKRGKALDLACGKGNFSMFLIKNHWKVDSVDLQNKIKETFFGNTKKKQDGDASPLKETKNDEQLYWHKVPVDNNIGIAKPISSLINNL